MAPKKAKTPAVGADRGYQKARVDGNQHRQFSAKATSGAAQRLRILEALRAGPKTSFELRRRGIYQHSVRVFELRRAGYSITTTRVTLFDHDGFEHRGCALYSLSEPAEGKRE